MSDPVALVLTIQVLAAIGLLLWLWWTLGKAERAWSAISAERRADQQRRIQAADERAERIDAWLTRMEELNARTKALADDLNTR